MGIFTEFGKLDRLSQHVFINRLAVMIGEEPPYNLNKGFEEEIQAVYDELNQNEDNPERYYTQQNCVVYESGEIAMWVDGNGYQGTGCFVNDEF